MRTLAVPADEFLFRQRSDLDQAHLAVFFTLDVEAAIKVGLGLLVMCPPMHQVAAVVDVLTAATKIEGP